jgi:hypothetical protein
MALALEHGETSTGRHIGCRVALVIDCHLVSHQVNIRCHEAEGQSRSKIQSEDVEHKKEHEPLATELLPSFSFLSSYLG